MTEMREIDFQVFDLRKIRQDIVLIPSAK